MIRFVISTASLRLAFGFSMMKFFRNALTARTWGRTKKNGAVLFSGMFTAAFRLCTMCMLFPLLFFFSLCCSFVLSTARFYADRKPVNVRIQ